MLMTHKLMLGVCFLCFVIIGELYAFSLHFETRAKVFRAHFVVLVQVFLGLVSKFLWKNLADLNLKAKPASASNSSSSAPEINNENTRWTAWKTVLSVYLVLSHLSYLTNLVFIGKDPHWFAMLAYCALGSYLQLATAVAFLKAFNVGLRFVKWKAGGGSRNSVIISKQSTAVLAILYAVCAAFIGLTAAAQVPQVKNVTVPIRGLAQSWQNTRIVQICDIHLGPTVGFSKLSAIVDIVNSLHPGNWAIYISS